ncbi:MAG: ATP synthase F0 subunit B [Desulfobulbaceae bacterium]|nr:ATP synthase F0 subunit B [Desulfobulbaceae bacterium]
MRAQIVKIILPVLLALALGAAPFVFASGQGAAAVTVGDDQALHGVEAAHEANKAAEDMKHGDVAGAEHEKQLAAEHNAEVAGAEHGGEHKAPMITAEKLKDLFWRTVNFIALVVILVKFLAKPISSGLSGRRRQIKEELEELQDKRDEAERSYKEFVSRLAGMEQEMDTIVERAIAQAVTEKARILEEAERAAEDIKRQAEAAVAAELVDAKRTLRNEVAEQAAAMAEELIVKNLTAEDQVAITEQYLERVGAVQ